MTDTNERDALVEPERKSTESDLTTKAQNETAEAAGATANATPAEATPARETKAAAEGVAKLHAPHLDGADIAAAANHAAAKAWEKYRAHILNRIAEKEIARDIVTLAGMTEIYCADHHAAADRTPYESEATAVGMYPQHKIPRLCPECAAHLRTAKFAEHCADASRAPHAKRARAIATHPPNRHGNAAPWPMRAPGQCSAGTRLKQFATLSIRGRARGSHLRRQNAQRRAAPRPTSHRRQTPETTRRLEVFLPGLRFHLQKKGSIPQLSRPLRFIIDA